MERFFEKVNFKQEARFELLQNVIMLIPELSQFAIYTVATDFVTSRKVVKDFHANQLGFGHPSISEYASGNYSASRQFPESVTHRDFSLDQMLVS